VAEGFISRRKRHVSKDRVLLARLEDLVAKGEADGEIGDSLNDAASETCVCLLRPEIISQPRRRPSRQSRSEVSFRTDDGKDAVAAESLRDVVDPSIDVSCRRCLEGCRFRTGTRN
jgi:hypothetical protein